jgi:hypothetical protein
MLLSSGSGRIAKRSICQWHGVDCGTAVDAEGDVTGAGGPAEGRVPEGGTGIWHTKPLAGRYPSPTHTAPKSVY